MAKPQALVSSTGRRKSATANVQFFSGSGSITINGLEAGDYLKRETLLMIVKEPLKVAGAEGNYDIAVRAKGGGLSGQAGAIRLGIARGLVHMDEELRKTFRGDGLLTRDPRSVERKKPGQPGARRRFQFSKR